MSRSSRYDLEKRAKQGSRGYPIATIAFYGPTADFASKVAVAVFRAELPASAKTIPTSEPGRADRIRCGIGHSGSKPAPKTEVPTRSRRSCCDGHDSQPGHRRGRVIAAPQDRWGRR